jgi:DNA (cytosine-5)-methyltransferase 1
MNSGGMYSLPRVLELFCGIGGFAAALGSHGKVVAAVDIDRTALDIYARNFPHPTMARTIDSIPPADYQAWEADLWWLSPPCQPYTRRGRQRDLEDPRSAAIVAVIERIEQLRPASLALENVPPFADSQTCLRLRHVLERCDYHVREYVVCPTRLGIPNRRNRFYLVASRHPLLPPIWPVSRMRPLSDFLDESPDPALHVPDVVVERYASAIDRVDAEGFCSSCFTAAYGRSPVRSGSYLKTSRGLRRFSPREILLLLGFPPSFRLPPDLPRRQAWRYAGNSLSVVAVRHLLSAFPAMGETSVSDVANDSNEPCRNRPAGGI